MPTSRSGRFRSTSVRHRTSWELGPETAAVGGPQQFDTSRSELAGSFAAVLADGITLVRTRGEVLIFLTTAAAQGDGYHGAFGIAKATAAAITAGVASVPTPITEDNWDGWLYHRYFSILSAGPIAVATAAQEALQVNSTTAALRFEVDSKAMRKADIDEGFYAAIEVVEHGTAEAEWTFNSRLLVKTMT